MNYELKQVSGNRYSVYVNDVEAVQLEGLNFYIPGTVIFKDSVRYTGAGGLAGAFAKSAVQPEPATTFKYVDSSNGDEVYKVTIIGGKPVACTCKAWTYSKNGNPCKHMRSVK